MYVLDVIEVGTNFSNYLLIFMLEQTVPIMNKETVQQYGRALHFIIPQATEQNNNRLSAE